MREKNTQARARCVFLSLSLSLSLAPAHRQAGADGGRGRQGWGHAPAAWGGVWQAWAVCASEKGRRRAGRLKSAAKGGGGDAARSRPRAPDPRPRVVSECPCTLALSRPALAPPLLSCRRRTPPANANRPHLFTQGRCAHVPRLQPHAGTAASDGKGFFLFFSACSLFPSFLGTLKTRAAPLHRPPRPPQSSDGVILRLCVGIWVELRHSLSPYFTHIKNRGHKAHGGKFFFPPFPSTPSPAPAACTPQFPPGGCPRYTCRPRRPFWGGAR